MVNGHLCLVLHAHLPFVRHPEYSDFLEEDWLFEAITEVYLPLLEALEGLQADGIDYRLTMSITPTLATMLADSTLQQRYLEHLDMLIELSARETERTRWIPELKSLAEGYHKRFVRCRDQFTNRYGYNLLNGFRRLYESGCLELLTCAATHAFLPLLLNPKAAWVQIETGCREFESHFGRRPKGIWLPECGYIKGLDLHLRDAGIEYFFVETHGLLFAEPRPKYGVYAPVLCPETGVAALGRDSECSRQVWSSVEGYPGDPVYRDFHSDIGFDLEFEYLRPYLHRPSHRTPTGIKYKRITGPGSKKENYRPAAASKRVKEHAIDFLKHRQSQCQFLRESMTEELPIVVAPFDAELFGHWWYEGPQWLDALLREIHKQNSLGLITVPEYLEQNPKVQASQPSDSTWGSKGYSEVWLEPCNDWIYPHLHEIADRMVELAQQNPGATGLMRRALNQAARELLLAQSSDWAFIMKMNTSVQYAIESTKIHILAFNHLYEQIRKKQIDEMWLREIESRHNCFATLDYQLYA